MSKVPSAPHDKTLEYIEKHYCVHQGIVYRIRDAYVGSINGDGHRHFKIPVEYGQLTVSAHHIAWFLYYKKWPEQQLDHEDRDKLNNSKGNLRYANNHLNAGNKVRKMEHLPPGVKLKKSGYYEAYIRHNGRKIYCGHGKTPYEAFQCYREMYLGIYGVDYPDILGGGGVLDFDLM